MTNLKRIINEKGVLQKWLAEQVGVTEVSMSRYIRNGRIPKAPLAIRIADALGVDVKELYGLEPEERTQERTETHACDCISRQAAIAEFSCCELTPDGGIDANYAIDFLKHLPSAQPDLSEYSDKLWRSAYDRGKSEAQQKLIETIRHYSQYPDGMDRLLKIYSEGRREE